MPAAVPADVAHVLDELAAVLPEGAGAKALYGGGSLATGDYRPVVSDLDLVAMVDEPLAGTQRRLLAGQHRRLAAEHSAAAKLHCAYVPIRLVADLDARHSTWAHGRFLSRPLVAIARAELLAGAVVVLGPPPAELLPPVSRADLDAAARTELATIWLPITRRPWLWLDDTYVDLGLLTLARADATLSEGRLLTKSQALGRLPTFGVPPHLVEEIARRRDGEPVVTDRVGRARRALLVRHLVATGIQRALSATGPGPSGPAHAARGPLS